MMRTLWAAGVWMLLASACADGAPAPALGSAAADTALGSGETLPVASVDAAAATDSGAPDSGAADAAELPDTQPETADASWADAPVADLDPADAVVSDAQEGDAAPPLDALGPEPDALAPETLPDDIAFVDAAPADTTAPDVAAPDTAVPDTAVPDTAVPDTAVPDTAAPDTAAPDTAAPDTGPPPPVECAPAAAQCPKAPAECNQVGGSAGPTAGKLVAVAPAGFMLYDTGTWATNAGLIASIAAKTTATAATLDSVLGDLNRVATSISSHPDVPCFNSGFTWEAGDQDVAYWIPQGIAGTATANTANSWAGKKVLVVSWYYDPAATATPSLNKGSRLAVVDVTSLAAAKYRLVLLAEPVTKNGVATLQPIEVHAGGISWQNNYLYVADTSHGFRVFDWNQLLQVQTTKSDVLGESGGSFYAYGYKYVLPQVGRYTLCASSCCARFSFVEADMSTNPPSLLAGEYSVDSTLGRLHRWPLDPATGRLQTVANTVHASEVLYPGMIKVQGAQSWNGHYVMSSSAAKTTTPKGAGSLYRATVGSSVAVHEWPHHPEDFTYSPTSDNLWCLTEDAGERAVFSVKLQSLLGGCGQ